MAECDPCNTSKLSNLLHQSLWWTHLRYHWKINKLINQLVCISFYCPLYRLIISRVLLQIASLTNSPKPRNSSFTTRNNKQMFDIYAWKTSDTKIVGHKLSFACPWVIQLINGVISAAPLWMSFTVTGLTSLSFFIQCVPTEDMIFKTSQHTVVVLTDTLSHILNWVPHQLQQTDNNFRIKK